MGSDPVADPDLVVCQGVARAVSEAVGVGIPPRRPRELAFEDVEPPPSALGMNTV